MDDKAKNKDEMIEEDIMLSEPPLTQEENIEETEFDEEGEIGEESVEESNEMITSNKEQLPKEKESTKIFDMFSTENIKIEDPSLRRYINLQPKLIVKTKGRESWKKFGKGRVNIIERMINLVGVPGHRGKKHKIMTKTGPGRFSRNAKFVIQALKIVQEKTNQNPVQVLIKAIENAAPCDEVTSIEYGGARYSQAVDCSPLRRLNLALRNIVHGAYDKSFNKKKTIAVALAEEIILSAENSRDSLAIGKKYELEKQADAAR